MFQPLKSCIPLEKVYFTCNHRISVEFYWSTITALLALSYQTIAVNQQLCTVYASFSMSCSTAYETTAYCTVRNVYQLVLFWQNVSAF